MRLSDVLATPLLAERGKREGSETWDTREGPVGHHRDRRSAIGLITLDSMARTGAQSAGISIFRTSVQDVLAWIIALGKLAEFQGYRFPLRHSLCGVRFDRSATQLVMEPHLYFQWIAQAGISISEALLRPSRPPAAPCMEPSGR